MSERDSYYGRAVIKEPVWTWEVPAYFFTGGLGGAAATLAFAAELTGNRPLARGARLASAAGIAASPALLVSDLGRPKRFLNMLRVFKVSSPMSVGSWLLSAMGGAASIAAVHELTGALPRAAGPARAAAAAMGPPLATYTAVLTATTANPAWHGARKELPFVFAGGAAASAGAAAAALTPGSHAAPARRLAIGGAAAAQVATLVMERRLGPLARPYKEGRGGAFSKASRGLSASGAALMAHAGGGRGRTLAASALMLGGALCERYAVFEAGFTAARDPAYTVEPQRARARANA